jgi:hypothetical protein
MSEHQPHDLSDRLIDLAGDYAAGWSQSGDLQELELLDSDSSAREAFDAVAAQIDSAYGELDMVDMPAGLEDRLFAAIPGSVNAASASALEQEPKLQLTDAPVPTPAAGVSTPASTGSGGGAWFPWLVAAASIALAVTVIVRPDSPNAISPSQARDQLIAQADPASLVRYDWTPTEDPAVVGEVSGELIWDDATQQGYMTISGLEVNDPSTFQYQLWIFDATAPQGVLPFEGFGGLLSQRPIDGGVFDITQSGEVVIPIDAKLLVKQGVAFAITVEQPGGVVVSDRSRVPLLATPKG